MYCQSNNWWRFCKILWPSLNICTLLTLSLKIINAILKYQCYHCYRHEFPTLKSNLFSNNLVLEIGSSVLGSIKLLSIIIKTHTLRRPQKYDEIKFSFRLKLLLTWFLIIFLILSNFSDLRIYEFYSCAILSY